MATKGNIKSQKSEEASYVAFENRSPRTVTLYWHDYTGKLVRYAIIKPGGLYKIDTFVTHPWSSSDSESGDRHLIHNQFVFYPPPQEQNDEVPRYEHVYIDLPGMSNNIDLPTGARGTELPLPLFYLSVYIFIFNQISLFLYYFICFSLF
jgi:hypothetical protein